MRVRVRVRVRVNFVEGCAFWGSAHFGWAIILWAHV